MENFEMGLRVVDRITGFRGQVTAKCEYITGCKQYLVQPKMSEAGEFREPRWFDQDRLMYDGPVSSLPTHTQDGPDVAAPIK